MFPCSPVPLFSPFPPPNVVVLSRSFSPFVAMSSTFLVAVNEETPLDCVCRFLFTPLVFVDDQLFAPLGVTLFVLMSAVCHVINV